MECHWTLKTPVATEPITLVDAKQHARIDHDDEDEAIERSISAARSWVEAYTGRSLAAQTWQLSASCWPYVLWLPRATPLSSVTHVKYYDADNTLQTLSSSVYTSPSFHEPARLQLVNGQSWPSIYSRSDAVQVEYVTGYATNGAIPRPLLQAILLLVTYWHSQRENVLVGEVSQEIAFGASALCAPYRVFWREPEA
jgi:uncharacterized phiE125 gp8 family phage protein